MPIIKCSITKPKIFCCICSFFPNCFQPTQLVGDPFRMTNCVGAQLGRANNYQLPIHNYQLTRISKVCHAESILRRRLKLESLVENSSITKPKNILFYLQFLPKLFSAYATYVRSFQDDKLGGGATCVRSFQDDKLGGGATWERNLCEILSG